MKIKYKKIIRTFHVEPTKLIKNIITELNRSGYRIRYQTPSNIEFKYNYWGFGSRADVFTKIDGGEFDIIEADKTIVFSYYLSPIFEIIASCIAAFFGITQDNHIFFFIIFIAIMFVIRLISTKTVANNMIENVLNPELP